MIVKIYDFHLVSIMQVESFGVSQDILATLWVNFHDQEALPVLKLPTQLPWRRRKKKVVKRSETNIEIE